MHGCEIKYFYEFKILISRQIRIPTIVDLKKNIMELKEFIASTLSQIAEGAKEAKTIYASSGGEIAPRGVVVGNLPVIKSHDGDRHGRLLVMLSLMLHSQMVHQVRHQKV